MRCLEDTGHKLPRDRRYSIHRTQTTQRHCIWKRCLYWDKKYRIQFLKCYHQEKKYQVDKNLLLVKKQQQELPGNQRTCSSVGKQEIQGKQRKCSSVRIQEMQVDKRTFLSGGKNWGLVAEAMLSSPSGPMLIRVYFIESRRKELYLVNTDCIVSRRKERYLGHIDFTESRRTELIFTQIFGKAKANVFTDVLWLSGLLLLLLLPLLLLLLLLYFYF